MTFLLREVAGPRRDGGRHLPVSTYVEFLLLGLGNGGVFAALAMALVVTYRSSGVLNFATGAQALYAAYTYSLLRNGQLLIPIPGLGPTVSVGSSWGFWPALAVTLGVQAVLGALAYLLIFRPLRNHRPVAKAVASIGLMGVLTAVVSYQVGSQVIEVNPIFPQNHVHLLGVAIATDRLWLAAMIIGLGIVLTVLFRFTRFGLATRASAETEVGALVSGLSPDRIALVNWMISFVVCGIAGVLIAPLVPLVPGTYTLFIVPALAAAVVGRFHSLGWAITAGLGIGGLESLSVYVNGVHPGFPAGAGELIPLVLVLVVLAARGEIMPSRGTLTQVTLGRAPRPRWRIPTAIVGFGLGLAAIYVFTGNDRAGLYTSFITAIITLSLVVVTGYTGQISLAQLTFAGVSAYILSTFANSWGIPFPIAPILAALVAAGAGVIIGIPALRVRGLMLGVVTLTFAAGVEAIWFDNNSIDGGASGLNIPTPRLFGVNLGIGSGKDFPRPAFGILCLVVLVLVAFGVSWLRTSRLGTAMLAVRADERSAAAAGINVVRVKLVGFALAAFIAGLGGSLLAYQLGNVTFQDFDAFLGLVLFSVVVVAGITSVSGGILAGMITSGGILVTAISSNVGQGGVDNWYGVIAGIGVILTVIFNPEGIVGPVHLALEQQRVRGAAARRGGAPLPSLRPASETHVSAPTPAPAWSGTRGGIGRHSGRRLCGGRDQRARDRSCGRCRQAVARGTRPHRPLRRRGSGRRGVLHRGGGTDRRAHRPQRRRQDDDDRRPVRLSSLRRFGRPRRREHRPLAPAPAGRPRARPHLPAGRRLRRPHGGGERAGRTAPGRPCRLRRSRPASSTSSALPRCATSRCPSSRRDSASWSRSPGRWPASRACCSSTSRRQGSTAPRACGSPTACATSARPGSPSCWSTMT